MTTVLRASDSADFLGIVPALAGFTPRRSVVLLPFQGSRTHGAMRLDLPSGDTDLEAYADAAVGLIARVSGTDAVAVVVYSDEGPESTSDGLVLPVAVAVDELLWRAEDAGLRIVDALCVTPRGWSSYLADEPLLGDLGDLAPVPEVPGLGDVAGDQLAGTALPVADLARKERVARALREIGELLDHDAIGPLTGREGPAALAGIAALADIPAFFEALLEHPDATPVSATGALLWCLDRPVFRDVALAQWATGVDGGIRTLQAQLAFARDGRMISDDLGAVFLGMGPAPDPDRLRLALEVVRYAAAAAPRACRPGPLTAAAWLSWALGRSSHAGHYLDLVRDIDPQYGLAALLRTMVDAAVLPEWTFRRGGAAAAGSAT
ncbi:DUF4192 family protein [Microbacterium saperdae]|uniref:Uncharacterized protein DUF4192 n=1 Tax=Microbacterium saperdae TaxID=69368 RepID=A0A543BC86_9MICO|nr:DUF4192 family protein [Microbacterium saperdae]TQL82455.1 uncharacterized protein DUF4192 [Microbacterium saperdae]GGM40004.1 hypothetical protein GCM10010489_08780 [Microbacterium saperdae]